MMSSPSSHHLLHKRLMAKNQDNAIKQKALERLYRLLKSFSKMFPSNLFHCQVPLKPGFRLFFCFM